MAVAVQCSMTTPGATVNLRRSCFRAHECGIVQSLDILPMSAVRVATCAGCAGTLYFANSRDVLGPRACGTAPSRRRLSPRDCWGFSARAHVYLCEGKIHFPCPTSPADTPTLLHPDPGHAIHRILHLEFVSADCKRGEPHSAAGIAEQRRLGLVCAEQISLAIANVKLRDQLRDQSIRDALTGMFNRRYMLETCRREFSRAARGGLPVSILSIDVDHFKKFNDNHGHDAGDTVLPRRRPAEEQLPRRDGRSGSAVEEFVVLLPGATLEAAAQNADEIRARIEGAVVRYVDGNLPRVTSRSAWRPTGRGRHSAVGAEAADEALIGQGRRPQPRGVFGECRCAGVARCSPGTLAAARRGGEPDATGPTQAEWRGHGRRGLMRGGRAVAWRRRTMRSGPLVPAC